MIVDFVDLKEQKVKNQKIFILKKDSDNSYERGAFTINLDIPAIFAEKKVLARFSVPKGNGHELVEAIENLIKGGIIELRIGKGKNEKSKIDYNF